MTCMRGFSPPPFSSYQLTPPPSTTAPIHYPPLSVPFSLSFHSVSLSFCFFLSPLNTPTHTHTPLTQHIICHHIHIEAKTPMPSAPIHTHIHGSMHTVVEHLLRVTGFIGGRDKRLEGCTKDIRFNRGQATQSFSAWQKAKQLSN